MHDTIVENSEEAPVSLLHETEELGAEKNDCLDVREIMGSSLEDFVTNHDNPLEKLDVTVPMKNHEESKSLISRSPNDSKEENESLSPNDPNSPSINDKHDSNFSLKPSNSMVENNSSINIVQEDFQNKEKNYEKMKRKNPKRIVDSDSEDQMDDDKVTKTEINLRDSPTDHRKFKPTRRRIIQRTLESDSEDDNLPLQTNDTENNITLNVEPPNLVSSCKEVDNPSNRTTEHGSLLKDDSSTITTSSTLRDRIRKILDSDSENDTSFFSKISKDNISPPQQSSKTDLDLANSNPLPIFSSKQNRDKLLQSLADSDSSEDEHRAQLHEEQHEVDEPAFQKTKQKSAPRRKGSSRASKSDAMKQIYSETQRLIRETEVSLPYHRPKQRSLKEFLSRKSIAPVLPKARTTAAKLKLSSSIVSKVLEEKAKEAELFYKSSDSEDENKNSPSSTNLPSDSNNPSTVIDKPIENNLPKAAHVAKKLFQSDSLDIVENESKDCEEVDDSVKGIIDHLIESVVDNIHHENANVKQINIHSECETTDLENHCNYKEGSDISKLYSQSTTEEQESTKIQSDDETEDFVLRVPDTCDCLDYSDTCSKCTNNHTTKEESEIDIPSDSKLNKFIKAKEDKKRESLTAKQKFANLFTTTKPTLKGNPGMVIDLTEDKPRKKNGIDNLIERFISKHSIASKQAPNDSKLTIVTLEESSNGFIPVKQDLTCTTSIPENLNSEFKKPGAKLLELRRELQQKIALKRCELMKQKEINETELTTTKDESDDDDEEEELEDEVSESGESEPEEDDVIIKDKKYRSHDFADDEAEVSEEEEENHGDEESEIEDAEDPEVNDDNSKEQKKFEDDASNVTSIQSENKSRANFDAFGNDDEEQGYTSDTEYNITHQKYTTQTQYCKTPLTKPSIFDLISPSSQLSGINSIGIDSVRKDIFCQDSNDCSQNDSRTKICEDLNEKTTEDELLELCSGEFVSQDETETNLMEREKQDPTESQLLSLCSGTFQSKTMNMKELETDSKENHSFQSMKSLLDEDPASNLPTPPKESHKNRLLSSSDDDDTHSISRKKKKYQKIPQKLVLSDDEESIKMARFSDEEEDSLSEEEQFENKDEYIDYDSEENEILTVPAIDIKKVAAGFVEEEAELSESEWGSADEDEHNLDELEAEEADNENIDENQMRAQIGKVQMRQMLDEDQRNVRILQEMFFEDGDLHTDGNGRERKFRWKNIDKLGNDNDNIQTLDEQDQWFDYIGNEDSSNWRKLKQERQSFLEKQVKDVADIDDDILGDSQIFQLGIKALKKTQSNQLPKDIVQSKKAEEEVIMSRSMSWALNGFPPNENKRLSNNPIHRQSLLARGEETLARLATVVKEHDVTTIKSKTSRHFIFETVSPSTMQKDETEKTEDTGNTRKRKPPTSVTPKTIKKMKNDNNNSKGKQLFAGS